MDKFFMKRNPDNKLLFDVIERFGKNEVRRAVGVDHDRAAKLVEAGNISYLHEKDTK